MTYDADGLRSSKTVGTRKTEYQYVGDKLFYEKRGDNQTFYYFYDSFGNLSMIRYTLVGSDNSVSTATYLVQTNSQGDVVALYTKAGNLYARYEYDAWGNTLSVTDANGNPVTAWYNIANANPIRYRGYYYDSDLRLYYLQSRYYDSEIGRFINADSFVTTGQGVMSYNMYSYCQNNPVNATDPSGCFSFKTFLSSALDIIFDLMERSSNRKISLTGSFLKAVKKGYDTGDAIINIDNPLDSASKIKEQYVNDIYDVGTVGEYITTTPDPYVFPDVHEYNIRCQTMFDYLSNDPAYSDCTNTNFDKVEAMNTILVWDEQTTNKISGNTVFVAFSETMIEIMEAIYA